jgi:excisionase family DNA binding protein
VVIEPLWTVREVAAFLRASTSWVYKAAERGDLPCIRLGALLRFRPSAIQEHLEKQAAPKVIPLDVQGR